MDPNLVLQANIFKWPLRVSYISLCFINWYYMAHTFSNFSLKAPHQDLIDLPF